MRAAQLVRQTTAIQQKLLDRLPKQAPARAPVPSGRGQFVADSYANAAGVRAYKVYTPPGASAEPRPLVVLLHGCSQDPDDFAAGTRMNLLADELGFVAVYPAQSRSANASSCWNWFEAAHQRREQGEPSLIAGITRAVLARGLDARRVYVAGLSAGGAMAAVMGATYPELFAAVGSHSGLPYGAAQDLPSAFAAMQGTVTARARRELGVPLIAFHGDEDRTVHPSNSGVTAANGTRIVTEQGEQNGRSYTRTMHLIAPGKAIVEHWIVHGAGHAWTGGSASGSFTDPRGPDASREMLRFFLQHSTKG